MQRLVNLVKAITSALNSHSISSPGSIAEFLKLLNHILPSISSLYDEFWGDLWYYIATLLACGWAQPVALPMLHATLKLCALYNRLATEESNEDLVEVWQDYGGASKLAADLIEPLRQHSSLMKDQNPSSGSETLHGKNRPMFVVMSLLGRILSGLPVKDIESWDELYQILTSEEREVQSATFDVIHRCISETREDKSMDVALSKQRDHLPEGLLSLLIDPPSITEINESVLPYEVLWARPRSYLLAWKLVFDHFPNAVCVP